MRRIVVPVAIFLGNHAPALWTGVAFTDFGVDLIPLRPAGESEMAVTAEDGGGMLKRFAGRTAAGLTFHGLAHDGNP